MPASDAEAFARTRMEGISNGNFGVKSLVGTMSDLCLNLLMLNNLVGALVSSASRPLKGARGSEYLSDCEQITMILGQGGALRKHHN
jgi:hypothetical protein